MLHTNTVLPGTLELLKFVMMSESFKDFALAGGTSLSLQIGHRMSDDLDFFGQSVIRVEDFSEELARFGECQVVHRTANIVVFRINDIKVDFVNYSYPLLQPISDIDGVRVVSLIDIAAMKLSAIAGRGRKRDFVDVFYLLQRMSLKEMLEAYRRKYHDGSDLMVLRSLTYFEDADSDSDPIVFEKPEWESIKKTIRAAFEDYKL